MRDYASCVSIAWDPSQLHLSQLLISSRPIKLIERIGHVFGLAPMLVSCDMVESGELPPGALTFSWRIARPYNVYSQRPLVMTCGTRMCVILLNVGSKISWGGLNHGQILNHKLSVCLFVWGHGLKCFWPGTEVGFRLCARGQRLLVQGIVWWIYN